MRMAGGRGLVAGFRRALTNATGSADGQKELKNIAIPGFVRVA
jgi:hypothetical protein